jgi:hypothetical protein
MTETPLIPNRSTNIPTKQQAQDPVVERLQEPR